MRYPRIHDFAPDDSYFEEIFPKVWLMDNHKWAYFVWEKHTIETNEKGPFALFHAHYHWDAVNDFKDSTRIGTLNELGTIDAVIALTASDQIKKDSFIAPAIIRGLVDEVHFFCKQMDNQHGFWPPFIKQYGAAQHIHSDAITFRSYSGSKPILFDLDLDLFNSSEMWAEGDLWEETDIIQFIENCSELIQSSTIVTIAMSFGYSGTESDTNYLTQLATSVIESIL